MKRRALTLRFLCHLGFVIRPSDFVIGVPVRDE